MSHCVSIKTKLTDLAAVKLACEEMGLTFKPDQKHYKWWGTSVGDYPLPNGFTKADLGKCEHAIGVPGTDWEVGVCKLKDGSGYTLLYDFYGSSGQPILKALGGEQAPKFVQTYGVHKATLEAKKKGYFVTRTTNPQGQPRLVITGVK